ncbi:MAG TPA: glutaredoxin family protein [Candidatus Berkiella sp.]|nr:glutaredoxin family protein [Candidatus Berkiella sp.]
MKNAQNLFIRLAMLLSLIIGFSSSGLQAKEKAVVLYSTSWCSYCKQVRDFLKSEGVAYVDYDIENSEEAKRKFQAAHGQGVPLIFVGQTRLEGFDRQQLKAELLKQGIIKR